MKGERNMIELSRELKMAEKVHMKNEMAERVEKLFVKNQFTLVNESTKAYEFKHFSKQENVYYLLQNKTITIVLNPETVRNHEAFGHGVKYHSTALRTFPRKMNTGEKEIAYGYSFKFSKEGELDAFLEKINKI
jgi:hypothetical protein